MFKQNLFIFFGRFVIVKINRLGVHLLLEEIYCILKLLRFDGSLFVVFVFVIEADKTTVTLTADTSLDHFHVNLLNNISF